ncbi:MAG: SPOR domain-containing protein [Dichotomicrobium sp.]
MPRSDDSNGFPPGRRRREQTAPEWARGERSRDWRYPDPSERYAQDYDDYDTQPARDPFADEWQSGPPRNDMDFDAPRGREDFPSEPAAPSWSHQDVPDDPFDWDAPEPPAESGWGDDGYDEEGFGSNPWAEPDSPFQAEPETPRRTMRDDSLFRRIDGSAQDPDLASLTGAGREDSHAADPFGDDLGRDPAELRDRFFSRAEGPDDPYAGRAGAAPGDNVFDFDPRRGAARAPEYDDPYSWDSYDDDPPMVAPQAAAPPPARAYADPYRPYDDDPDLHPEDDVDADFLDDEPDDLGAPAEPPKSRRTLMVAGVLVAAVATGGAAAFLYKNFENGNLMNGNAPTLLADDQPVKGEPSDPGGKEFPDGNKQIYDRLSGDPAEPVEEADAGGDSESGTATVPGIVTTGAEAPADTLDERIAAALRKSGKGNEGTSSAAATDTDSPRPVRTLTVRPDGSVVPARAQKANTMENQPDESQTVTTAGIVSTTGSGTSEAETGGSAASETETGGETASKEETASAEADDQADKPRAEEPEATRVASVEPTTATDAQQSTASANPFFVQIAARRDQTSALAAFADLQQRYPKILDGLAPTIKKADLGDKGIWYRLWVGPMDSRGNAQDVCGQLKQAGLGGCFVRTE